MTVSMRVMVTGMGAFTPLSKNCADFQEALFASRDSIAPIKTFDVSGFQSHLASVFDSLPDVGFSEDEKRWMDRATYFAVVALREAMAQAQLSLGAVSPQRIGVCLGSSHSGLVETETVITAALKGELKNLDPRKICSALVSHCTSVVKRMVGAEGRVITFSSACASSNTAIGVGADLIRRGEVDVVISGGADSVSLSVIAGFNALRALSKTKTAPFSNPLGLNLGEGAGIVILESEASALKRGVDSLAEILGYGLSGDAYHATAPDVSGRGALEAMREALSSAHCTPEQIDYVNAHGTGTEANDSAESQAMLRVFGINTPISSMKSFLGHTLGASGVLELIGTVLMAKRGFAPHGLRFTSLRSGCAVLDYVRDIPRPGRFKTVMVNNFGFGGNNSSLVACLPDDGSFVRSPSTVCQGSVMVAGVGTVCAARDSLSAFSENRFKPFARSAKSAKWSIQALQMALGEDAGVYDHNPKSGLIYGAVFGAQKPTEKFMESVFLGDPALANAHFFPMTTLNANGGIVSLAFGITGYTTTVCGGAAALCYALDLVRDGRQERVATVSGDEVTPHLISVCQHAEIIGVDGAPNALKEPTPRSDAPRGTRATGSSSTTYGQDQKAWGTLQEGSTALLFEQAETLAKRSRTPLAKITGWAHFQDPRDSGVKPNGDALCRAISSALEQANLSVGCIGGIVALASGPEPIPTSVWRALSRTFGTKIPPVLADPISVVGYGLSSAPLWTVAEAVSVLSSRNDLTHVLALGVDLIGDHYAILISALGRLA